MYLERLENSMINLLEEMASKNHPVELLMELKFVTLKAIVDIFIGPYNKKRTNRIADLCRNVYEGVFSLPINVPGFAFHRAMKARKKLDEIFQTVVEERKTMIKNGEVLEKKDLVDILLEIKDEENGRKIQDHEIIDLLVMFLFAGHETTGSIMLLATTYLARNPLVWKKAKEEQEQIIKARPPSQKHLSLAEIKQMDYLNTVIDETLRMSLTFAGFRQAIADVDINGYTIPKGWIVLIWGRGSHVDPELFPNPDEFNPSRWNDYKQTTGTFLPFGAGTRLCPGRDLTKLEIRIFLHHFLLNYKLEQVNPEGPVKSFPAAFTPKDNCLAKVIRVSSA